jgi:hypothetical protein
LHYQELLQVSVDKYIEGMFIYNEDDSIAEKKGFFDRKLIERIVG